MFARPKVFVCPSYINLSKRLLSNEFREVLNTRLEPPAGINGNQLQLAVVSKNLNALNLDLFVNNLNQFEDKRSAVLDLLSNIRATKQANSCLESTNFAVVRHLLDNSSIQELVPVLMDRPQFGIFLNNFTGFAVTQTLHNEKEYVLAMPLSLKLVLLDELDSIFIQTFCVKSCLTALKKELSAEPASEDKTTTPPPKGKVQEKKIRLPFLRNPADNNINHEMGKALVKIASQVLVGSAKDNANILGSVLSEKYVELKKILASNTSGINKDTADICKELLTRANQPELVAEIDNLAAKISTNTSFEEVIDGLLTEAVRKEDKLLAEKQSQLLPTWQQLREQKKVEIENEIAGKERIKDIEKITGEISTKKELLWFFDQEDKLDLEIYKKRVFYPKRWFGKKKKPRVVDEHYVPPQIRKIH